MKAHKQTEPDTVNVSILIVEDDKWQSAGAKNDLENISSERKLQLGITGFNVQVAKSLNEATQLLTLAKESPFDLLLLDLGLPKNEGEREEECGGGFKILDFVRTSGAAKEVLVISRFSQYESVRRAFQGGALDFLAKPYKQDELQARVAECWKRVLAKKSSDVLKQHHERRIKVFLPYDRKRIDQEFSFCFSRTIQDVMDNVEAIETELAERLGLDTRRDQQDSLLRPLAATRDSIRKAKRKWLELQSKIQKPRPDSGSKQCGVISLLNRIKSDLLPCLMVKNVRLEVPHSDEVYVLSFQDDVHEVLNEIIAGALIEREDSGNPERIDISVTQESGYAKVTLESKFFRLGSDDSARIEKRELMPNEEVGRRWALSVAQYIALCGGGQLQIEYLPSSASISYLIPLATDT